MSSYAKFLTTKKTDESVKYAEEKALEHYNAVLRVTGQKEISSLSVHSWDFNRGFEYGVQWALENTSWLDDHKEYSRLINQIELNRPKQK